MSKKALEKHLESLSKAQASELVMELYHKFPQVKTYFNFVFHPNEKKLMEEARLKVANEYFPLKRKRPKARRSIAQNYIKHFINLGVSEELICEFMWYNLALMQTFSASKPQGIAFYKSVLSSFRKALQFVNYHQLLPLYKNQILDMYQASKDWPNAYDFEQSLSLIDDI